MMGYEPRALPTIISETSLPAVQDHLNPLLAIVTIYFSLFLSRIHPASSGLISPIYLVTLPPCHLATSSPGSPQRLIILHPSTLLTYHIIILTPRTSSLSSHLVLAFVLALNLILSHPRPHP